MLHNIRRIRRALRVVQRGRETLNETLALQLERRAARHPDRLCLRFEQQRFSYAQANAQVNRYAAAHAGLGIGRGDVVALMLENRPEFLWHVLGLHKLGAVASLINTQLTGDVLLHALRVCAPKRILVGAELWPAIAAVHAQLGPELAAGVCVERDGEASGVPEGAVDFAALAARASDANPPTSGQQRLSDLAAYIYTSGTTGLPKPALIKHDRFYRAGHAWSALALDSRPGDVMYNCLPLYHSNGLVLAAGSAITAGITLALARKFSRRRFWDDIRESGATQFIYIGELLRYLLAAEPSAADRDHRVRVVTGNGLRPELWPEFQRRFGIGRVAEFYAATEGNCITINFFNLVGSVGPMMPGMALAKVDPATQELARDAAGRLIRAAPGEPGILLGRIGRNREFEGYRDQRDTERKIIRDAFVAGDAYFNTGDLLRMDHLRHLHFVDRLGDTFRWKGENVATSEVEAQLAKWRDTSEVIVYGVQVPGADGRAGMAALVLKPGRTFDPAAFAAHVDASLPAYARPLFVRLTGALATTGTFKLRKGDLQREGFDPGVVTDPLYVRDARQGRFVPLDPELFERLTAGELRL